MSNAAIEHEKKIAELEKRVTRLEHTLLKLSNIFRNLYGMGYPDHFILMDKIIKESLFNE